MRKCRKCNKIKDESFFYKRKNRPSGYEYWCKECCREYQHEWKKDNEEYKIQDKENCKKHYQNNKKHYQKKQRDYGKTLEGKIAGKKHYAKRKRNLGFTVLLENKFNCDVDYHHINNEYVIAVPRYMHRGTLGKNHRVECNSLVEKLYDIDIKNEVEKYGKN